MPTKPTKPKAKRRRVTALYARVSSDSQTTASQEPDLQRWAEAYAQGPVRWYRETASGKSMNRPQWQQLEEDIRRGRISRVVVWKLDRLGRSVSGLSNLFTMLREYRVPLVSISEGFDLTSPAGKLTAHVLASVAEFENEHRAERVKAGIAAARARGVKWGGSKKGTRLKLTKDKEEVIVQHYQQGKTVAAIMKTVELSRETVYKVLRKHNTVDRLDNPTKAEVPAV